MGILDAPGVNPSTQPVIVSGLTQAAIEAAFATAGTSRSVHFPAGVYSLTNTLPFVIGTDGVHPTQAGHDYYARRAAQGIAALLSA